LAGSRGHEGSLGDQNVLMHDGFGEAVRLSPSTSRTRFLHQGGLFGYKALLGRSAPINALEFAIFSVTPREAEIGEN